MSDEDAEKMMRKMTDATFDFDDFMAQAKMVSSMGNMGNVMSMMPGNKRSNV